MSTRQYELPKAEDVFNLAGQEADDPWRVERERQVAERLRLEAEEYRQRMQMRLEECPGFAGCDAPPSPMGRGKVVVEPRLASEARLWLKRRFHVAENLELSSVGGLVFEIAPRIRLVTKGAKRVRVTFAKPVQYELSL